MKRFLKTLALLVVALLLLVSGVDAALDQISIQPTQASFTLYNQKGETLLTYNGSLAACERFIHVGRVGPRPFQARSVFAPRA